MGRDLILTAAHLVDGATSIAVALDPGPTAGATITEAAVIAIDRSADLAMLRTDRALPGHIFALATHDPEIGDRVALIGFPFGDPRLSARFGYVGDLDRTEQFTDDEDRRVTVSKLFTTDAAINPGNSGGPVLTPDGAVAGVVSGKRLWVDTQIAAEGTGWAVSTAGNARRIESWRGRRPLPSADCGGPDEQRDDRPLAVSISADHPDASLVAQSLALHGGAINQGQYDVAYALFTPAMRRRMGGVATWSRGLGTSFWLAIDVLRVTGIGRGRVLTSVRLRRN